MRFSVYASASMRVLVAPQEFKGTLSAQRAIEAISRGLCRASPGVEIDAAPLADGGPGTVDAFLAHTEGERKVTRVAGPLGAPVEAGWALVDGGKTAVLEMAAASGLSLLSEHERDLLRANTLGTGELIRAALDQGCTRLLVGVGGSATNDGGIGAAHALGARFLDAQGTPLAPEPRLLPRLARVDLSGRDPRLARVRLEVLTDVKNPLCGAEGASRVYGPQKGADADLAERLDGVLQHLASIVRSQLGLDLERLPGAGAAGGLAFGLAAFCGAELRSGFDVVSETLGLYRRVREADLVITGEGRIDAQTAYFKGPYALGRLARMQAKRVVAFAGSLGVVASTRDAFDEIVPVTQEGALPAESREAEELLEAAVFAWARDALPARGD